MNRKIVFFLLTLFGIATMVIAGIAAINSYQSLSDLINPTEEELTQYKTRVIFFLGTTIGSAVLIIIAFASFISCNNFIKSSPK